MQTQACHKSKHWWCMPVSKTWTAHLKSLVKSDSVTVFVDIYQNTIAFYHDAILVWLSYAATRLSLNGV